MMGYHANKLGVHTHTTHADAGDDNTKRPKTGLGRNDNMMVIMIMMIILSTIMIIIKILIALHVCVMIFMMIAIVISCTDGMLWQYKYKIRSKPQHGDPWVSMR